MWFPRPVPMPGLYTEPWDTLAVARLAVSAGNVLMFDLAMSDGDSKSLTFGALNSGTTNVIAPSATGVQGGAILCVALQDASDDTLFKVRIWGIVDSVNTAATVAKGDRLVATVAKTLDPVLADGERYIGICQFAATGASAGPVLFDGFYGFGTYKS